MKDAILLILLAFTSGSIALAQTGTIKGRVISEINRDPVEFATIQITDMDGGTSADEAGRFMIENVPAGEKRLVIRSIGYREETKRVTVNAGETTDLYITLQTSSISLAEVVVTGTMRETFVKDSPVKVEVVNLKRLEQGKASSNFMDLIGSVNGLSTQLNCGVCGTNAIRINGVEGPNTAVLIDGMPIMGALASVYGLNGISPSIIDHVEVIKGPQSTLYGSEALGGVVNIITKNPEKTPTLSVNTYGESTTHEGNINLAVSPKLGRFKGFLSGDLTRNQHYFDKNGDGFNDKPNQTRYALFAKGVLEGKNGEQRLNVAAKLLNEDRTGGEKGFTDDLRGSSEVYGESIYTNRAELLTEFRPAGFDEKLRLKTAVTHHSQDSYYGDNRYDATQNIVFGQGTWDQPLGERFRLLTGATLRYQTYDDNTTATSEGANRRFIPGVFAQGELSMGKMTLLGGMRVDHQSEHGFVTSPRVSAKYSPSGLTTLRASSGTGFRVVNVFTEDHAALTGSREVVFKEDLDPERSWSVTASMDQLIPFEVNPMSISLDGFYTRFSNKIIPDYDQDPNLIVYGNLDGYSVTQGFAIGVDQDFTSFPLSYNVSYTLMDVFVEENEDRTAVTYAPDFLGNFGMSYQFRDIKTSLSYSGNLVGSKRMPDNYVVNFGRPRQSPVYTTHNLKITKEFLNVNDAKGVGFEMFVSAENIFDFTQGTPLVDSATPFSEDFDTIYTWGPIVGRTFKLGARLTLR